jgi:hypothetical protein
MLAAPAAKLVTHFALNLIHGAVIWLIFDHVDMQLERTGAARNARGVNVR